MRTTSGRQLVVMATRQRRQQQSPEMILSKSRKITAKWVGVKTKYEIKVEINKMN